MAFVKRVWPYASATASVTVEVPVWPDATLKLVAQERVDEPQPEFKTTPVAGSNVALLLVAVTVNAPLPATVKATGAMESPAVMD